MSAAAPTTVAGSTPIADSVDVLVDATAAAGSAAGQDASAAAIASALHDLLERTRDLESLQRLYSAEDAQMVAAHLSNLWSVRALEGSLHALHDAAFFAGVPWWGTIVAATLALRLALAPVNVALLRNTLRLKVAMPQVLQLDAVMRGQGSQEERLAAARALPALLAASGCSPWQGLVTFPLLLPPAILSFFGAMNNLAMSTPAMSVEGALWFTDLLVNDRTYLLPLLSAATWLLNVESGAGVYYHASPGAKLLVRTGASMFWALGANMPAGVLLFWITSNVFAICRGYVTRMDAVRRRLGIPLAADIARLAHLPRAVI